MNGKSSARRDKIEKNKNLSVNTAAISIMFAQDETMTIRHEILKENHETMVKDYQSLQERFKQVHEMNDMMKLHLQNQTRELEETNIRLLKDLESDRSEKDKYKKMIEEMKRMENELMIKNEEILISKGKGEEELKKMQDKYNELADRFGIVEKECSYLKSLYDSENLIGQGGNKEVIVVDHNVNKTVTDAIVISDDSDAEEYNNPSRVCNKITQWSLDIKQEEECSNGANSSKVNRLSSSSSSSSSDEYVLVQLPVKRSRDDYNKS